MAESSWIAKYEFKDPDELHVHHRTGKHYVHRGVSKAKFTAMQQAKSLGQFMAIHINKQHPGVLVKD